MKLLPLTKGYFSKVDDEDFERLIKHKWCVVKKRTGSNIYAQMQVGKKKYSLHRFILGLTDPQVLVDHINGDSLDNRRENLRACTAAENTRNRAPLRKNATGFKGVSRTASGKFLAEIKKHKKRYRLGRFKTAGEAARAYDAKAKELFGEFAYLNFPDTINQNEGVRP